MKKVLRFGASALALVSLSACATPPNKIAAAYVSPLKYQTYDCQQIAIEQAAVENKTNTLYHSLRKRSKGDDVKMGVGMLVFWPSLLFMKGNNSAQNAEYAQLKGDYEALRSTATAKRCDLAFADDLSKSVKSEAPAAGAATAPKK